jgi:hypothetical protein
MQQFADKYAGGDMTAAIPAAMTLQRKGELVLAEDLSPEQKVLNRIQSEVNIEEAANDADRDEELIKDARANARREGRAKYPEIELDYPTKVKMFEHKRKFMTDLRLAEDQIETGCSESGYVMKIKNITDAELNAIKRTYGADRAITAAVGMIDTGAQKITGGVGYTADKVIAPAVQVGARVGASVLKTVLKTAIKTGSTLLTATSQGVKQAGHEIKDDPDVLRAGRELLSVKDTVMRRVGSYGTSNTSGIRIKSEG